MGLRLAVLRFEHVFGWQDGCDADETARTSDSATFCNVDLAPLGSNFHGRGPVSVVSVSGRLPCNADLQRRGQGARGSAVSLQRHGELCKALLT